MQYNTQQLTEIKYQIFPRYIGVPVLTPNSEGMCTFELLPFIGKADYKLQLLPLSSITDEHKILVGELMNETEDLLYWGSYWVKRYVKEDIRSQTMYQLFQLLGYATQQTVILDGKPVTLSVEEQIELGIIELKNKTISMEVRIQIDCGTIQELEGHLHMLQVQIQDKVKQLKLNPSTDDFDSDVEKDLYDDNCYGTHYVTIQQDGDTEEAQRHFLKFIDSHEHGENPDAESLWNFCFNKREIIN